MGRNVSEYVNALTELDHAIEAFAEAAETQKRHLLDRTPTGATTGDPTEDQLHARAVCLQQGRIDMADQIRKEISLRVNNAWPVTKNNTKTIGEK